MSKRGAKPVAKAEIIDSSSKKKVRFSSMKVKLAFLLGIIAFMVYANTLKNDYAYDDISTITKNSFVTAGISAVPQILATPYRRGYFKTPNDLYRPLSVAMFAVEYEVFNGAPMPMHFINVLFFAGCVILLFFFLDAFFDQEKTGIAFTASLLFALHPIHTEVVANIKSRDDLLCFFFAFLCMNLFIKYTRNGRAFQLVTGVLSFFLSLLSKETAITFLAVIPLVFFFYVNENKKRSIHIFAGAAVMAIVFLFIRFSVLNAYDANHSSVFFFIDNALADPPSVESRYATAIFTLGMYLKLLFVPYPLICDYAYNSIPFVNFNNEWVLLSLVTYTALITFGIYRIRKFRKDPLAFAIAFFLFTIAIFSNIPFLIGSAMAERFLFFPSVSFCFVLALLIEKLIVTKPVTIQSVATNKIALAILIPLSLIYIFITANRNSDWKDSLTLYSADIKKTPDNARLHCFLGVEYVNKSTTITNDSATQKRLVDEGMNAFKKALAIYPEYSAAHSDLGNAFYFTGQPDSAKLHFELAIKLDSTDLEAINHLDFIYFYEQRYRESIALCKRALAIDPNYTRGYCNIGMCYVRLQLYDSAIYFLHKAISADPGFNLSYESIAIAHDRSGNADSARKYESIAQIQDPSFHVH